MAPPGRHAGTVRVLVTGGAGFIGRPSVRRLVAAGHQVTVLDSLRADVHHGRAADLPEGVRLVVADVRDGDAVASALDEADRVVHLAAKVGLGVGVDDIEDYVSSNDLGTAVLLRAAARTGVEHVVLASSMVVYGEGAYDCPTHGRVAAEPRLVADLAAGVFDPRCPRCRVVLAPALVTEEAPADPRNVYAATKVHGEHLLSSWARLTGASATALRFHNVYGPGMPRDTPYAGVAAIFRSTLARGVAPRVFEDGGQRRDFVHVDDVAAAVTAAATQGATGGPPSPPAGTLVALNVGSGTVTTVNDLAEELARVLGGPPPVVTGEFRVGDVRHITASSARAREVLGWRARIELADGLADLVTRG